MAKQKDRKGSKVERITIHNKVSNSFRETHADGAFINITPNSYLNLCFYAERFPIPKSSNFEITKDNQIQKLSDSDDSKDGVIREYEFGIYIDIETAKGLRDALGDVINHMEGIKNGK